MANFRLIDIAKPLLPFFPEVETPFERVGFDDKLIYSVFITFIYLFAQFPLAGLEKDSQPAVNDPIYFLRGVFAAEPRTLLEFGLFPVFASALIMQLCAGLKLIDVNFKVKTDRELFQTCTKLFALLQYFILANIFVMAGYYGTDLTFWQILLVITQLTGAGMFAILLTEVIDKGLGFTSGAMLINTAVIATNTIADTLGIAQITMDEAGNTEAQGSIINLLQSFRAKHRGFFASIFSAFTRDYLPNLTTTVILLAIAGVVCYFSSARYEVPIRSTRARSMSNIYPIRLMYCGALSVIFSYVLLFYIHVCAFVIIQIIGKNDPSGLICKIFSHYENVNNILAVPTFPLSLLTPPRSLLKGIVRQPLTFITFTAFVVMTGIWFANQWQQISGSSAFDIAKEFKDQGVTLAGRREQNIAKELNKIIPTAAMTGAALLGLLTVAGEFLGLKGKAAGIVVGIAGAFSLLEIVTLEYQETGGSSTLASMLNNAAGLQ